MEHANYQLSNCQDPIHIDWVSQLEETQESLCSFLEKLEQRMQELTQAALPKLEALKLSAEGSYGHMLSGVKEQLNAERDKAIHAYDDKVEDFYDLILREIHISHPQYKLIRDFRIRCSERFYQQFDACFNGCQHQLDSTSFTNYELLYQQIVDEYEHVKNKFHCYRCGSSILLEKIYFSVVQLACPCCEAKNTFKPSALAQGLEHIGRGLAEQRAKPLLEKYHQAQQREKELYQQCLQLKLKYSLAKHKAEKQHLLQEIAALELRRMETHAAAPELFQHYQRTMFDDWKKLVPDLAEQTESLYQSLQRRNL